MGSLSALMRAFNGGLHEKEAQQPAPLDRPGYRGDRRRLDGVAGLERNPSEAARKQEAEMLKQRADDLARKLTQLEQEFKTV